jgi:multiple antibiotic resistance protein
MLAGPGSISTVMVLVSQASDWVHGSIIFSAIAFTSAISFIILSAAGSVRSILGETGIRVMTRMMGLLLTAIAVQFILNGIMDLRILQ